MAHLGEIMTQVNAIQSKLQEVIQQLTQVTSMVPTNRSAPQSSPRCSRVSDYSTHVPIIIDVIVFLFFVFQCSSRQRWLFYVAPVVLSWPILIKHLISYLAKK